MNKNLDTLVFRTFLPYPADESTSGLGEIFKGSFFTEMAYGREAFFYIINYFKKKNNRLPSFSMPDFICRDVPDTLDQMGARYSYYKVDRNLQPDLDSLRKNVKNDNPDYIIVVNYFGFPADLEKVMTVIKGSKIEIIEDNAHGFLSKDEDGKELGFRGDWGIFSLRKTFPLQNGALVVAKEPVHLPKGLRPYQSIAWKTTVKNFVRGLVPIIGVKNFVTLLVKTRKPSYSGTVTAKPFELCPPIDVKYNLGRYSLVKNIENRRLLFDELLSLSSELKIKPIFNSLGRSVVPYGFPFVALEEIGKVREKLAQLGLEIFKWPEFNAKSEASVEDFFKNIWVVRFMW